MTRRNSHSGYRGIDDDSISRGPAQAFVRCSNDEPNSMIGFAQSMTNEKIGPTQSSFFKRTGFLPPHIDQDPSECEAVPRQLISNKSPTYLYVSNINLSLIHI